MRSDLATLLAVFRSYLSLPDPATVLVTLAPVVAARMGAYPLWLMKVGPPSAGKTEPDESLAGLDDVRYLSTFTQAGLLSGSPGNKGTGGVLVQLAGGGTIVIKDLTTLLSERGEAHAEKFAFMREVFDGRVSRALGTSGGRVYEWICQRTVSCTASCTEVIDAMSLAMMGERFLLYRLPRLATAEAEEELGLAALNNLDRHAEQREALRAGVVEYMSQLQLPERLPDLAEGEKRRLVRLATFAARCRSAVHRNGRDREVELVPQPERSPRLSQSLGVLLGALRIMGAEDTEVWRIVNQVALDGMHSGRRRVLDVLLAVTADQATAAIAGRARLPLTTARRHLEDLCAHEVVDLRGEYPERWALSERTRTTCQELGVGPRTCVVCRFPIHPAAPPLPGANRGFRHATCEEEVS